MSDNKKNHQITQEEDFAAIRRVLAGDNAAFKIIEKRYRKLIASLIRRMIKNEDDVDDLTQETFIKAYNALHTFHFGFSFSSWIYRIASNNCIDFIRKRRFPTVSLDQPISKSEDEQYIEIVDNTYVPDVDVLSEERRNAIMTAIENLPDNYKNIIKLRHEEELDYAQIAEQLNIPLGTVKAHLFRARKLLFSTLKKQKYLFF
jgi:RNA polymerase sigma-70 factor (ECF subfamily)